MTRTGRTPIAIALLLATAVAASVTVRASAPEVSHAAAARPVADADESPNLIATTDLNGDGLADVVEIVLPPDGHSGAASLLLQFGQKDGSFRAAPKPIALDDDPQSLATGDFNGDGNADLLIGYKDGAVKELLGDGKGNLRLAGEVAHVGSAVSIAVGDFNRDGIPDVAISDLGGNTVEIFLGTGHGSFRLGWSFALPMKGVIFYLAAADFNGDGVSDLAITSGEDGTFVVMLGNGNGTFTYAPSLSNIRDPNSYCPT
jgi:hypothetical protein